MERKRFQALQNFKDSCHVNTKLLPIKIHYFFMFGAFSGVLPFFPVIAKELGISATAVGIGFSVLPIFTLLSNPIIGFIADYLQNLKIFLMVLLITRVCSYSFILTLSPISNHTESLVDVNISYYNESIYPVNTSMTLRKSCLEKHFNEDIECESGFERKISSLVNGTTTATYLMNYVNISSKASKRDPFEKKTSSGYSIYFHSENDTLSELKDNLKSFLCFPNIHQCSVSTEFTSVFKTHQYWLFFTFIVVGSITGTASASLTSVACYEILSIQKKPKEAYGRQRLFGIIGWGLACLLAGVFNDMLISSEKSFLSGFYLMAAFMIVDMIDLSIIHITKASTPSSICTNAGKLMSSKENLVFAFGVIFIGVFASMIDVYEFWLLEDMGASQTLLGLTIAIQCLVGEVPFMFFSGWLVNKFGHYLCFVGVFSAYTIRLFLYSIIENPWFALPIGMLHGITHGLFHVTMVSFANVKAPEGMEATLMGFFGGLYNGLGYGLGCFLCGFGVDELGPRKTFFTTSMMSVGCLLSFLVASYVFRPFPRIVQSPQNNLNEIIESQT